MIKYNYTRFNNIKLNRKKSIKTRIRGGLTKSYCPIWELPYLDKLTAIFLYYLIKNQNLNYLATKKSNN